MKPFELLKKALDCAEWPEGTEAVADNAHDLLAELDRDLTLEEYPWEEDSKIEGLTDKLEDAIKELEEAQTDDDDLDDDDEDEDEDDDDDLADFEDEEDEDEVTK